MAYRKRRELVGRDGRRTRSVSGLLASGAEPVALSRSGNEGRQICRDQRATRNKKAHEPKFVGFLDNSW